MNDSRESSGLRLFIALPIPESVKIEIERAQNELRRMLPKAAARWTRRDQFHVTLKFLGNVEPSRVPELIEAMKAACSGFGAWELRAERLGCFPSLRFPRVIWVWVYDEANRLLRLQNSIEQGVEKFSDGTKEKAFTGHVTIGRINKINRTGVQMLAEAAQSWVERRFGSWTANEVKLMQSELGPSGAIHMELASIPLVV